MNDVEEQIQSIDLSIEHARYLIEKADAFQRLQENKDFQLVIEKGFFQDEARRAVLLRADPNQQTPEDQAAINNVITTIGGLFQYFNTIVTLGNRSKRALAEDEQTREEILSEAISEGALQ